LITRCWTATDACSNTVTQCQFITVRPIPPVVSGPDDQTVCPGRTATFCATVSSACPTTNQWYKDGVPIPGATNVCLTLVNITPDSAGQYCIRVVGPCHSVTNCAVLTVLSNVTVQVPPPGCPARGTTVSLCPVISGPGPITCVWRKQIAPGIF